MWQPQQRQPQQRQPQPQQPQPPPSLLQPSLPQQQPSLLRPSSPQQHQQPSSYRPLPSSSSPLLRAFSSPPPPSSSSLVVPFASSLLHLFWPYQHELVHSFAHRQGFHQISLQQEEDGYWEGVWPLSQPSLPQEGWLQQLLQPQHHQQERDELLHQGRDELHQEEDGHWHHKWLGIPREQVNERVVVVGEEGRRRQA